MSHIISREALAGVYEFQIAASTREHKVLLIRLTVMPDGVYAVTFVVKGRNGESEASALTTAVRFYNEITEEAK